MENRTSCTSGKNGPASDALMDREHQVSGETTELACVLEARFKRRWKYLHPLPSPNQVETETRLHDSSPLRTACKRDKAGDKEFSHSIFIAPGKPVQNAFAESFIGRLRGELLGETCSHRSRTPAVLEAWRQRRSAPPRTAAITAQQGIRPPDFNRR